MKRTAKSTLSQIQSARWRYDEEGQIIWAIDPFGNGSDYRLADLRGWGHLTGHGAIALKMTSEAAVKVQDRLGQWIVDRHNAELDL